MFEKPPTRTLRSKKYYSKCFFQLSAEAIIIIFQKKFFKRLKFQFKSYQFSINNGRRSQLSSFYCITNHKNFISKYLENALIDFAQTSRTLKQFLKEKLRLTMLKKSYQCLEIRLQVKQVMASFRCYDNSDVILTSNHKIFLSLSNTAVVTIFSNLC